MPFSAHPKHNFPPRFTPYIIAQLECNCPPQLTSSIIPHLEYNYQFENNDDCTNAQPEVATFEAFLSGETEKSFLDILSGAWTQPIPPFSAGPSNHNDETDESEDEDSEDEDEDEEEDDVVIIFRTYPL